MPKPNILFLMSDQLQARVFDPDHPCRTPNIDRVIARGVRVRNAYTPNAICSPARASLMTGLLPHNHGMLYVEHNVDPDQSCLRTEHPHFAQHLEKAGYETAYFGKWHVERSRELDRFGWRTHDISTRPADAAPAEFVLRTDNVHDGYNTTPLYGVVTNPPEQRPMGAVTKNALGFLQKLGSNGLGTETPWCCFVSLTEPHDPFICGKEAFDTYDVDSIPIPPNWHDDLAERPGLYRKAARIWQHLSDRQKQEAAACYYASITEIDTQFGKIIDAVDRAGQLENTIICVMSDHGESLGAHGLYCKNISASEEIYTIPMILAGPGIKNGKTTTARVGLHDLCPTILDLAGAEAITHPDSKSFSSLVADPDAHESEYTSGYAEYHGGRYIMTQRVVWEKNWKFVFNGFDFDELYDLDTDPYELKNLAADPEHHDRVRKMTETMWGVIRETHDKALLESQYAIFRIAAVGPNVAKGHA
ncbi:MAG: DUF229 domain-containing protein [Spirochaetaceae bacterium]|nr:MAG: DUF229 domain-containing protein [Spirochaetaceae bacterium]